MQQDSINMLQDFCGGGQGTPWNSFVVDPRGPLGTAKQIPVNWVVCDVPSRGWVWGIPLQKITALKLIWWITALVAS